MMLSDDCKNIRHVGIPNNLHIDNVDINRGERGKKRSRWICLQSIMCVQAQRLFD